MMWSLQMTTDRAPSLLGVNPGKEHLLLVAFNPDATSTAALLLAQFVKNSLFGLGAS
jgi:hypothetical protein